MCEREAVFRKLTTAQQELINAFDAKMQELIDANDRRLQLRHDGSVRCHELLEFGETEFDDSTNIESISVCSNQHEFPREPKCTLIRDVFDEKTVTDMHYGDFVMTDEYRGCGLYVIGYRRGELALVKTRGEYGYCLPYEFKHIPREYFKNWWGLVESYFFELDDPKIDPFEYVDCPAVSDYAFSGGALTKSAAKK
jgi:hypothetical protein